MWWASAIDSGDRSGSVRCSSMKVRMRESVCAPTPEASTCCPSMNPVTSAARRSTALRASRSPMCDWWSAVSEASVDRKFDTSAPTPSLQRRGTPMTRRRSGSALSRRRRGTRKTVIRNWSLKRGESPGPASQKTMSPGSRKTSLPPWRTATEPWTCRATYRTSSSPVSDSQGRTGARSSSEHRTVVRREPRPSVPVTFRRCPCGPVLRRPVSPRGAGLGGAVLCAARDIGAELVDSTPPRRLAVESRPGPPFSVKEPKIADMPASVPLCRGKTHQSADWAALFCVAGLTASQFSSLRRKALPCRTAARVGGLSRNAVRETKSWTVPRKRAAVTSTPARRS